MRKKNENNFTIDKKFQADRQSFQEISLAVDIQEKSVAIKKHLFYINIDKYFKDTAELNNIIKKLFVFFRIHTHSVQSIAVPFKEDK